MKQPFYPEMLEQNQLAAIALMQKNLREMARLAQLINTNIADHGLKIRGVPSVQYEAGRLDYDIQGALLAHDLDRARMRSALGAKREAA